MYYFLADTDSVQVERIFRHMQKIGLPVKLVITSWTQRLQKIREDSGLTSGQAVSFLELGVPSAATVEAQLPEIPAELSVKKISVPVTEYLDQNAKVRLRVETLYGKPWQVTYFEGNHQRVRIDFYDIRGFLCRTATAKTITDYLSDKSVRVVQDVPSGVSQVFDHGRELGTAENHQAVVAKLLDEVYQPGDVVLSAWDNHYYHSIAQLLIKQFAIQIGFIKDTGTLPADLFTFGHRLNAHYHEVSMTSQQRYQSGQFFSAPDVKRPFEYGRQVLKNFGALTGPKAQEYLRTHIGSAGQSFFVRQPTYFNTAINLHVGENFYANWNVTFLDDARIEIGDNAKIGPNCGLYTSGHPVNPFVRNSGFGIARPIVIGHNFWMGGNAVILGGVTLGNNVVVAAGAVVTQSFGDNVVLAGVPARIIRRVDFNQYDV